MSAIGGIWHIDGAPQPGIALSRMLDAQAIFGLDDCSAQTTGTVALGRRLMSILPEDSFDRQPYSFAGHSSRLVADVRLDNREELGTMLDLTQGDIAGKSDAACLAMTFERWGEAGLQRIRGAFAVAVWNARDETWLLARDPLGQKPLFYSWQPNLFAFASMPQGLHALPSVPCEVNSELLIQLAELVPRPDTPDRQAQGLFQNMEKVPAGHFVRVSRAGASLHRYWEPVLEPLHYRSPGDYEEAMRERLDRAVSRALRGTNGRVGAQLSGGLDSSSVTASAARLQASSGQTFTAFTAVPQTNFGNEPSHRFTNEAAHAAATASLYPNLEHVLVTGGERSPLESLAASWDLHAMPFVNLCNTPWVSAIHAAAKERKLRVLLTGVQGNFSISHTGMNLLPELASTLQWRRWWNAAEPLHRLRGTRWRALAFRSIGPQLPPWLRRTALHLGGRSASPLTDMSLLHPDLRRQREILPVAGETQVSGVDHARSRLSLFTRIDAATMAKGILAQWGIDERDPTCDQELVEFSLRVPDDQWLRDGMPSALLRNAMAGRLPNQVRFEFRRGLQGTDWHLALSKRLSPLRDEIEAQAASPLAAKHLDVPHMRRLVDNWPTANWHLPSVQLQYRTALLRALSAGYFFRRAEASAAT